MEDIPGHGIVPSGFSLCFEWTGQKNSLGRARAEVYVSYSVDNAWCDHKNVNSHKSFSSPWTWNISRSHQPFRLPGGFTPIVLIAVYFPPQVSTDLALKERNGTITNLEHMHPEAFINFIVVGDFNQVPLSKVLPKYFQHIDVNTQGDRLLYSPFRNAFKPLLHPVFGKSNHSSILLLPANRQKLKQAVPSVRTTHWSDQLEAVLQECFDHANWGMFLDSTDINENTEAGKRINSEMYRTHCLHKNKPWINSTVRAALNARHRLYL